MRFRSPTPRRRSCTSFATDATSSARCSRSRGYGPEQGRVDDAGIPYGSYARFWVEPERRAEFEHASDARRAAWVWRSYVNAARSGSAEVIEIRYEQVTADPVGAAAALAHQLAAPAEPLAVALAHAHGSSVGRYERDLDAEQLAEVEAEAGPLLRELGYV